MRETRVLLFHPPTGLFLRQDRCQTPVKNKSAMEPPNELGYLAAMMESAGVVCRIRDYPMIRAGRASFTGDLADFRPDMIVAGVTEATFPEDIAYCRMAKKTAPKIMTAVKVPYLSAGEAGARMREFPEIDVCLLRGYEYAAKEIAESLSNNRDLADVKGLVLKQDGVVHFTGERALVQNLDELPFPSRHLFDQRLYVRPDTGEPQATIQTARGCPYPCIYCLASKLEGEKVRMRSPANIVCEIKECVERYGIRNFFLRADTFTLDKAWVISLCRTIIETGLDIRWVANSRADTLDEERLEWMKKAGCWLISLGIESGNQEILDKMKKGITLEDSRKAVSLCRKFGIKSYCFYVIGMPWDTRETIMDTIRFAKELNGDFFLFHMAVPFAGTALCGEALAHGLFGGDGLYERSHFEPALRTLSLSAKEVKALWRKAHWTMYSSPKHLRQLLSNIRTFKGLLNYLRYGCGKLSELA